MEIIEGTSHSLSDQVLDDIARYRHRVFVEMLGWQVPVKQSRELDQFDRRDTWYIAARAPDGHLIGAGRLLPTHRPYLLAEVFPQLMRDVPMPRRHDIWELSRFAAVDFQEKAGGSPLRQFSSSIAAELLRAALRLAASQGVMHLITVSPLGVERLLRLAGFSFRRAAQPAVVDGELLFACWIDVPGPAAL